MTLVNGRNERGGRFLGQKELIIQGTINYLYTEYLNCPIKM